MKKTVSVLLLLALVLGLMAGCGEKKAESVTISYNGEDVTTLEMPNGTELSGLCAVVAPEGYTGDITWESDDFGVVKVSSTEGNECTLTAKKTGSAKVTVTCGDVSASVRVHVQKNQDMLSEREIALTVKGVPYSAEVCTLYFAEMYYDFADTYGDYAAYYGLDLSQGIGSLKDQSCNYSDDGTWYGYFLQCAVQQLTQVQALCDYADSIGVTLSEDEIADIQSQIDDLNEEAAEQGYDNADDYLEAHFGSGVTGTIYYDYLANKTLANKVYTDYEDSLTFTEDEITAHYAELGYEKGENNYKVTNMRHILIMAEADDNGEYTDEAIAAAHDRAEEIYEEWLAGDQTEESFAALATQYTDDTSSASTGGLYENIYKDQMVEGINDWLFAKGRTAGDTAVIDNNGSYVGTHIVYFVGKGELYSHVLSEEDLRDTALSEWFTALTEDYTAEEGADYSSIGEY